MNWTINAVGNVVQSFIDNLFTSILSIICGRLDVLSQDDAGEAIADAFHLPKINTRSRRGFAHAQIRLVELDGHSEEECIRACLDFIAYVTHQIPYNALTGEE